MRKNIYIYISCVEYIHTDSFSNWAGAAKRYYHIHVVVGFTSTYAIMQCPSPVVNHTPYQIVRCTGYNFMW